MKKLLQKTVVSLITISFVFNSGMNQIISYAKTIDVVPVFEVAKSTLTDFVLEKFKTIEEGAPQISLFTTQSEVSSLSVDVEKEEESISKNSNTSENDEAVNNAISASNVSLATASEGFTYEVYNSEVRITGYTGEDTEIVIPSEIDGMKVTSIRYAAFCDSSLTSITIPEGVTDIGWSAFSGCSSLTSITIPEGVTTIAASIFNRCSSLTSITIPKSVTTIEDNAFSGCSSLTNIIIPEGVTDIEWNAFYNCSGLKNITIPKSVTTIGNSVFEGCSSLTSITIPEGVTAIGNFLFKGCSSLTSITIPEGVTTIGNYAFKGCSSLTSVTIPEGVTIIGGNLFEGCSSLTNITIPEGVTAIGYGAFKGCSSLTSITIPEGVTSIENTTFSGCSSLTSITIPKSITTIGVDAFKGCSGLMSVTILEGVTTIGMSAFSGCSSLTSITIPKSVTTIGEGAFEGCSALESITIPEGVTRIASRIFYGCSSLTSITIPKSVTTIKSSAFEVCSSLTSITIPEGVTSIGSRIFYGCSSLTSIIIPGGLTTIGEEAFGECSGLTSITILEGVTIIGMGAFKGCSSLTSITIPKSVTTIRSSAFSRCSGLTSITIPDGVTTIDSYVFNGCSSLTSITIPESVTTIDDDAFYGCSSLTSITIPKGVTTIGEYAFCGCSSLTSVTIPEGVTAIGKSAFYRCINLKEIYMPNSIEEIGKNVFYNCTNLTMYVYKDSVSEKYAIEYNIPYKYRDYQDAIVIIPGVMGSRLFSDTDGYDEDSLIWEPLVKKDSIDGLKETYYNLKGLSDRLLSDTYVKPPQNQQFLEPHIKSQNAFGLEYREYGVRNTYKKLVDGLCESTDRPVYFFSYNWMQSNSDSADKLREFLEPFDHVDLVCHSMGGIVASSYMSKYKSDGKVDKIVTCGTPYEGSPAIINKMQNWDILENDDTLIFNKEKYDDVIGDAFLGLLGGLTKETKTKITTAAELVPSENYVSRVPMYKKGILFSQLISLDEYKTICKNIFKEKYDDGLIFQEAIKGSTGYNNLLDYDKAYFLIGTNQKTITSIVFDKSDDISSILYEDDLKYESKGDGTVPYISSTMSYAVKRLPEDRYCFADGDHTQIVKKAKTIEWIKEKLEINDETSTPSDDTTLSQAPIIGGVGYSVIRVACPVDVNIEANGEALNSSVSGFDTQTSFGRLDIIGQNDDIKMACIDTSDDYDVTLNGTDEGTMDYTIRYFNSDDELQSETTINDVPITKDTIITTKPVSTEDTVLNVDIDGDGTVDKTYTAPKGQTVDVEKVVKFNPNNGDQEIKRAVDSEGKLNYTPETPTKAGYTFVGWFKDTDDTTTKYESGATYTEDVTYTAKWAHVDMLGAQVKAVVDDKSGIRFGTKIYNDGDEIVEKGTIILPARLLPEGESLTLDTPKIAQSVGKVNYEVNEEKNYVTYLGTLVGIPRAQFDAEITASAYVIYKDKAGNEYTVYSPYKNGSTTVNTLLNS